MFPCEDSKTVSDCLYPEWRSHLSFVNISPALVIDTSMERSSRVLHHEISKIWKFSHKISKFEFWLVFWLEQKSWNHHSFVNISPTLVIDTSMERSSRVLQHGNPKIWLKKMKFEFWLVLKSWNHFSFVNISHALVIDTSMEMPSRVLQHGNPKICNFSKKSPKFEFWLVTKTCTYMMTSGMHRRPFEGRHLVNMNFWYLKIIHPKLKVWEPKTGHVLFWVVEIISMNWVLASQVSTGHETAPGIVIFCDNPHGNASNFPQEFFWI